MANPLLLPPPLASDERFRAMAQLTVRVSDLDLSPLLVYLVDTVEASALDYLAEQFSVIDDGGWSLAETDAIRRAWIKNAIDLHRHKGTVWAVKQVFVLLGLGDVDIEEGRGGYRRDGTMRRDGFPVRGDRSAHWAEYRVRCYRLLTVRQAKIAKTLLANIAPARSHLFEIDFSSAALIRNGFAKRDASYTRGTV